MERDFETVMIEQCAPVLAGLKPAGLFRYETRNRADLARRVAGWNAQLNPKGLQVRVLRGCIATRQYLVYVYRAAKLQTVLADAAVRGFLAREGYRLPEDAADCNALLDQLSLRLCCAAEAADFPHEIGVFLGYPLEDVVTINRNIIDVAAVVFYKLSRLHKHTAAATARVIHTALERLQHFYQRPHNAGRRKELAATLAFLLCKHRQAVFISASQNVLLAAMFDHFDVRKQVNDFTQPPFIQFRAREIFR